MTKFKIKRIVIFTGLLLLAGGSAGIYVAQELSESYLKQVWGGCAGGGNWGPCIAWGSCGGGGGGGSCHYDIETQACSGSCLSGCASGSSYACATLYGSCTAYEAICSPIDTYTCWPGMEDPPHCTCTKTGVNGQCWTQKCS